jgi:hypothetical protein
MVGEFIFRFFHPADLENRKFAQPGIELASEADLAADAVEGARHFRRVDQHLVQVGVAFQHVTIFGGDLIGLQIGRQAIGSSPSADQWSRESRSAPRSVTPPSATTI